MASVLLALLLGACGGGADTTPTQIPPTLTPTSNPATLSEQQVEQKVADLLETKSYQAALDVLDAHARGNPGSLFVRQQEVHVLAQWNHFTEAVEEYQKLTFQAKEHFPDLLLEIGLAAIDASDELDKEFAVEALGATGSAQVLPQLQDALTSSDKELRRSAALALGVLGSPAAIPSLRDALEDEDVRVRRYAAQALGRVGDASAIPDLQNALQDTDAEVRWNAAQALGELGDSAAIPELQLALLDEDARVRLATILALWKLTSES